MEHPDYLRNPTSVMRPDPRQDAFVRLDASGVRPLTLDDHHGNVCEVSLHEAVPESIRVQFETARNLYLYAWFVYRFFPIARSHAYSCLELALRERFESEMLSQGKRKRRHGPGLRKLLDHAVESGLLREQNFDIWRRKALVRARHRILMEGIEKMKRLGLKELAVDDEPPTIQPEDANFEFLSKLPQTMTFMRDHFAHGTTALDNQIIGTLRLVSEIINQVYASGTESSPQPRRKAGTFNSISGVGEMGFAGFRSVRTLRAHLTDHVPASPGVYLVLYKGTSVPAFLDESTAGWFKNKCPTLSVEDLRQWWLPDTPVLYIGKADGASGRSTLRARIGTYLRLGAGHRSPHWGGRAVWQIPDSDCLVIAWKKTGAARALSEEKALLARFEAEFGRLPFANLSH